MSPAHPASVEESRSPAQHSLGRRPLVTADPLCTVTMATPPSALVVSTDGFDQLPDVARRWIDSIDDETLAAVGQTPDEDKVLMRPGCLTTAVALHHSTYAVQYSSTVMSFPTIAFTFSLPHEIVAIIEHSITVTVHVPVVSWGTIPVWLMREAMTAAVEALQHPYDAIAVLDGQPLVKYLIPYRAQAYMTHYMPRRTSYQRPTALPPRSSTQIPATPRLNNNLPLPIVYL